MSLSPQQPHLIVVMGIAGTGKTTLGRLLAERLGYAFIDADDVHSAEAVELMRSGQPLPAPMRDAWMERLLELLAAKAEQQVDCVLAFSGLRAGHRRRLLQLPFEIFAFMLQGDSSLLAERLQRRKGHFMPATQLQHQLAALQPLESDERIRLVDIAAFSGDSDDLLRHIMQAIRA